MKTSIEKRRKICTFCEGLVHGFGQKLRFFHLLFLCKIDGEKVFFDSLDRKTSRFSL